MTEQQAGVLHPYVVFDAAVWMADEDFKEARDAAWAVRAQQVTALDAAHEAAVAGVPPGSAWREAHEAAMVAYDAGNLQSLAQYEQAVGAAAERRDAAVEAAWRYFTATKETAR